jgi:acyl-coenzyme A thioesterase PaaI-like protein
MSIKMSVAALTEFLNKTFPQVADDFVIEQVTEDSITIRLKVADRHLRPGGTVSASARRNWPLLPMPPSTSCASRPPIPI